VYTKHYPFELPGSLVIELEHLSRQTGYTLFTIYLAALNVLLYSYTGQEDLLMATLVANRTCRETEALIGLLANTVLLRTNLSGNPTLDEVLERVRTTTQEAYANQDLPFEVLVQVLERERGLQRASLCQVMVLWQNASVPPKPLTKAMLHFELADQSIELPNEELTTFDVIVMLRQQSDRLIGSVIYKTNLLNPEPIAQAIGNFQSVLEKLHDESKRITTKLLDL
jgi:non-ribosomal peptide synthetase component F